MKKLQSVLIINEDTFQALTQNKILSNTNYLLIHNSDSYSEVGEGIYDLKPNMILLDIALKKKDLNYTLEKILSGQRVPVISISCNKNTYHRYRKEERSQVVYFISTSSESLLSEILTNPSDFILSLS